MARIHSTPGRTGRSGIARRWACGAATVVLALAAMVGAAPAATAARTVTTWAPVTPLLTSGPASELLAVGARPDGSLVVGGNFTTWAGQPVNRVAHVAVDGTLDPTAPFNQAVAAQGPNHYVSAVTDLGDGTLLIGGNFTQWGGQQVNRLVQVNADGTLDPSTPFNQAVAAAGPNSDVDDITVLADGSLLIGGNFTHWGGQPAGYLVRIAADGTFDPAAPFNQNVAGVGLNGGVSDVATRPDGALILAGSFRAGGSGAHVMQLGADGTFDATTPFNQNVATSQPALSPVGAVLRSADGSLILGGGMTAWTGQPAGQVIQVAADGSFDPSTPFNRAVAAGSANGAVTDLAPGPDASLILAGRFTAWAGRAVDHLMRLAEAEVGIDPIADRADPVGSPVSVPVTVTAAHADPVFSFAATGLPAGVTIDAATGVMSGTPSTTGAFPVTVTATHPSTGAVVDTTFTWTVVSAADATRSTVTAAPAEVPADGVTPATVTVTVAGPSGTPLTIGGDDVVLTTTLGALGPVTDHQDGTYTAPLVSATAGTATIGFEVNGSPGTDTATVAFTPPSPDPGPAAGGEGTGHGTRGPGARVLARTGAEPGPWVALAGGAIAAGAVLVGLRARRARH